MLLNTCGSWMSSHEESASLIVMYSAVALPVSLVALAVRSSVHDQKMGQSSTVAGAYAQFNVRLRRRQSDKKI